jgi:hypothetical protein
VFGGALLLLIGMWFYIYDAFCWKRSNDTPEERRLKFQRRLIAKLEKLPVDPLDYVLDFNLVFPVTYVVNVVLISFQLFSRSDFRHACLAASAQCI